MLISKIREFDLFGDEEKSFDCHEVFEAIIGDVEDMNYTLDIISNVVGKLHEYLVEQTDYAEWAVNKGYDTYVDDEEQDDCENCNCYDSINKDDDNFVDGLLRAYDERGNIIKQLKEENNELLNENKALKSILKNIK